MSSAALTLLALLPSLILLCLLAWQDPKRRRSRRQPPASRALSRSALAGALLLPGVLLMLLGQWPAFLMWLGLLMSLGWLLVQLLAWRA